MTAGNTEPVPGAAAAAPAGPGGAAPRCRFSIPNRGTRQAAAPRPGHAGTGSGESGSLTRLQPLPAAVPSPRAAPGAPAPGGSSVPISGGCGAVAGSCGRAVFLPQLICYSYMPRGGAASRALAARRRDPPPLSRSGAGSRGGGGRLGNTGSVCPRASSSRRPGFQVPPPIPAGSPLCPCGMPWPCSPGLLGLGPGGVSSAVGTPGLRVHAAV